MCVKIKIVNGTTSNQSIVLHPFIQTVGFPNVQIGAYAKNMVMAGGTMYVTISKQFSIAGLYQNPDGSSVVTNKFPYKSGTSYVWDNEDAFRTEKNTLDKIILSNKSKNMKQFLIYSDLSCIWNDSIRPSMDITLPPVKDFLSNLGISIWDGGAFPTFFSSQTYGLHQLNTDHLSIEQCKYMTVELQENIGTGQLSLTSPDYTPFPAFNKA